MSKKLTYKEYFDKVYGCLIGKTVIGTLGAPFEGVKMPMELEFSPEMINTMLPNDDLDSQLVWLEARLEQYKDVTVFFFFHSFLDEEVGDATTSGNEYGYLLVCGHMCHAGGIRGFIWKIFEKLYDRFGIVTVCECGDEH